MVNVSIFGIVDPAYVHLVDIVKVKSVYEPSGPSVADAYTVSPVSVA